MQSPHVWFGMRILAFLLLAAPAVAAQSVALDSTIRVTWGAYVDAYYAYDLGRPASFDRAFTTQAARSNEFNVNLAHVEAVIAGARVRGRLAVQAGTAVHANYASEPTIGAVSGSTLARHLQEAYVGYRVSERLWIDAGIFFSTAGAEGWISSENLTYSRSLVADYSPYYASGVRAVFQASPQLTARVDLINGWQNISETNSGKALASRLDYSPRERVILSHYAYVGPEQAGHVRVFTGLSATAAISPALRVQAEADVGRQKRDGGGHDPWSGGALTAHWTFRPHTALVLRGEWYRDPRQVLIATGQSFGLRATGASIGLDVAPVAGLRWRSELRTLEAVNAVFPTRENPSGMSRANVVFMTGISLTVREAPRVE